MWRETLTHQIMIRIKCFSFNPFQECCTVASDESGKAVIVDPGCYDENEISVLTSYIAGSGLQIEKILLTHGHFDHIFGVSALAERYDVPVLMSPADKVFFFQAEDGIRDAVVTGFRRVLFRTTGDAAGNSASQYLTLRLQCRQKREAASPGSRMATS